MPMLETWHQFMCLRCGIVWRHGHMEKGHELRERNSERGLGGGISGADMPPGIFLIVGVFVAPAQTKEF